MDQGIVETVPIDLNEAGLDFEPPCDAQGDAVRAYLLSRPDWLLADPGLLAQLGLRAEASNVIEFGPVALSRASEAHERESSERRRLEDMARANFAAQTQTHEAVVDVLGAREIGELAGILDTIARERFGLACGALALEGGATPGGWRALVEGQVDLIFGSRAVARLGHVPTAVGLFGERAPRIASVALARLHIWRPTRMGVMAFGSEDPEAFTEDMGAELLIFLARVVERTAERWPRP